MIHQKSRNVNSHNQQPVTVAEYIAMNPLPAHLAHLEPVMLRIPSFVALMDIIMGCGAAGLDSDGLEYVLTQAADLFTEPAQRCAACLSWVKFFHVIAAILDDSQGLQVAALCDRCKRKVERGQQSETMARNLHSYVMGGAK